MSVVSTTFGPLESGLCPEMEYTVQSRTILGFTGHRKIASPSPDRLNRIGQRANDLHSEIGVLNVASIARTVLAKKPPCALLSRDAKIKEACPTGIATGTSM